MSEALPKIAWIAMLRKQKLSLEQIASRVGITTQNVQSLERVQVANFRIIYARTQRYNAVASSINISSQLAELVDSVYNYSGRISNPVVPRAATLQAVSKEVSVTPEPKRFHSANTSSIIRLQAPSDLVPFKNSRKKSHIFKSKTEDSFVTPRTYLEKPFSTQTITKQFSLEDEVKNLSQHMYLSANDVSQTYDLSIPQARALLNEVTGMRKGMRINYWLTQEASSGRTVGEIANLLQVETIYVRKLAVKLKLPINDPKGLHSTSIFAINYVPTTQREKDEMNAISSGMNIVEIGKKFGYSRENARQKIIKYGMFKQWKAARELSKPAANNFEKSKLLALMWLQAYRLAEKEQQTLKENYQMTFQVCEKYPHLDLASVYSFISQYRSLPVNTPLALGKLVTDTGLSLYQAKLIRDEFGVKL